VRLMHTKHGPVGAVRRYQHDERGVVVVLTRFSKQFGGGADVLQILTLDRIRADRVRQKVRVGSRS
jgi:hypothetical protein